MSCGQGLRCSSPCVSGPWPESVCARVQCHSRAKGRGPSCTLGDPSQQDLLPPGEPGHHTHMRVHEAHICTHCAHAYPCTGSATWRGCRHTAVATCPPEQAQALRLGLPHTLASVPQCQTSQLDQAGPHPAGHSSPTHLPPFCPPLPTALGRTTRHLPSSKGHVWVRTASGVAGQLCGRV